MNKTAGNILVHVLVNKCTHLGKISRSRIAG